jgi:hypothetical protein
MNDKLDAIQQFNPSLIEKVSKNLIYKRREFHSHKPDYRFPLSEIDVVATSGAIVVDSLLEVVLS